MDTKSDLPEGARFVAEMVFELLEAEGVRFDDFLLALLRLRGDKRDAELSRRIPSIE